MRTNFSRHLVTCHSDQEEVKQYLALSVKPPDERRRMRREITNSLRNKGNSEFNNEVVEGLRNDELMPVRRSFRGKHPVNNRTYVVCKHCAGFLKRNTFYKHFAKCKGKIVDAERTKHNLLSDNSELLVKKNAQAGRMLREDVFPKMQASDETVLAQSDQLICMYGSRFRFTHRSERQVYQCSSKMKTLARLVLTMKEIIPEVQTLRECIDPKHFNVLSEAVRRMSGFDPDNGQSRAPSVPARLCSSLKRCASLVQTCTIQNPSLTREEKNSTMSEMNDFLHLMEREWASEVSTNSENSRKRMRVMKEDVLPDPDDIATLSQYIHDRCPVYVDALKQMPTVDNYERLAKLIIAHIITFNRRRPNETVEITLETYRSTLDKRTEYGKDVENVLTEEELRSAQKLSIFFAAANKNLKKVPVLLTKTFVPAIEALIEARPKVGVTSKYLFGRPGNTELFSGTAVLRSIAAKANIKNISTFTANSLRHHAATSSQLMARNDTFTKRLSKFMGHDLSTHEHYYEMPLPIVQKSIVGHRLLSMILPSGSKSPASHTATSGALETSPPRSAATPQTAKGPTVDTDSPASLQNAIAPDSPTDPGGPIDSDRPEDTAGATEVDGAPLMSTPPRRVSGSDEGSVHSGVSGRKRKKKHQKKRWSEDEKRVIYSRFAKYFLLKVLPSRREIRQVWEEEESLKNRPLNVVVTYINNIHLKKQTIDTPIRKKMKNMIDNKRDKLSP